MVMPSDPSSLLGRVTRAATVSAATAALVASVFAALVADRVISSGEERRLRDQAAALLTELAPMSRDDAAHEVADEVRELEAIGLRIAVLEGEVFLGGDRALATRTDGCAVMDGIRRCAVTHGARTCVVGTRELIAGRLATFGIAALAALVIAFVLGTLIGRRSARWAVEPLTNLAARVSRAESTVPDLGSDDGVREVDELRRAFDSVWVRLADALATARRFSADAAHELRTPLTALSAELELLEENIKDATLRTELRRARATTAKLAKLTERLLVLARATDGVPRGDAVELGELVARVVAQLPEDEVSRVTIEDGDATIRGDESLIESLIENAIHNALLHGGGAVRVRVGELDGTVTLGVRDEGPGVPSDERQRLFEPFVRGRAKGGTDGHGIGLALIAHVAHAHGGAARFEDEPSGAHLSVTFPVWTPRAATE